MNPILCAPTSLWMRMPNMSTVKNTAPRNTTPKNTLNRKTL